MSTSIIICCHNSEARIAATLQALSRCETSNPVELILVDNGSTDSTLSIATNAWEKSGNPFSLQIIKEPQLGLAYARRAGVFNAKHDIVVFCDDDNWLAPDYLSIAEEIMLDITVGAAGGQIDPVFDGPSPTFAFSHGAWLALGIQWLRSEDVTHTRGFLWGAGLVVRRKCLLQIYGCRHFPIRLGRTGASLAQGDDAEICWALRVLGTRLLYDERLKLRHYIVRERLQLKYLQRLAAGVTEDMHIGRLVAGLEQLHSAGRGKAAIVNGLRWLRHLGWAEERRYRACLFLAACGLQNLIGGIEGQVCVAFESLRQSASNAGCTVGSGVSDP